MPPAFQLNRVRGNIRYCSIHNSYKRLSPPHTQVLLCVRHQKSNYHHQQTPPQTEFHQGYTAIPSQKLPNFTSTQPTGEFYGNSQQKQEDAIYHIQDCKRQYQHLMSEEAKVYRDTLQFMQNHAMRYHKELNRYEQVLGPLLFQTNPDDTVHSTIQENENKKNQQVQSQQYQPNIVKDTLGTSQETSTATLSTIATYLLEYHSEMIHKLSEIVSDKQRDNEHSFDALTINVLIEDHLQLRQKVIEFMYRFKSVYYGSE